MPLSALLPQIAIENSWNSSQSVGFYRPAANGEGGALLRGGFFRRTDNSGLFSAAFNNLPTSSNSVMGFRCVLALEQVYLKKTDISQSLQQLLLTEFFANFKKNQLVGIETSWSKYLSLRSQALANYCKASKSIKTIF